jgi:hypothetical protein
MISILIKSQLYIHNFGRIIGKALYFCISHIARANRILLLLHNLYSKCTLPTITTNSFFGPVMANVLLSYTSASFSIDSPLGNGASLSTLYLISSSTSIFKMTFLPTSFIFDLDTSNL